MNRESVARIADALAESSRILHDSVAGLAEKDAAWRPEPERWSVLDCVEHLALAERGLLGRIAASEASSPLPHDPGRETRATSALANREVRAEAPVRALPSGRFASLPQALDQFDTARRETLIFMREHQGELALRTVPHPFFGHVTGAEMLLIMAGHTRRHVAQILEIRAARSTA